MDGLGENTAITPGDDASYAPIAVIGPKLVILARKAIESYLRESKLPAVSQTVSHPVTNNGLFVTLWACSRAIGTAAPGEERTLRGCIGHLQSKLPLEDLVQEIAVAAATRDPRFPPLSSSEIGSIKIEIAILSPLREITSLQEIRIGEDGLLIEGLGRRGLLLPKVAIRLGWDQQDFFQGVCQKAGIPLDGWPDPCKLYAFTATIFEETDRDNPL